MYIVVHSYYKMNDFIFQLVLEGGYSMAIFIEEKSELGKLIWIRLKKMGKTQLWLSQEIKCSYLTLSKLCDGRTKNPSFKLLMNISQKLNIPPENILKALEKDNGWND